MADRHYQGDIGRGGSGRWDGGCINFRREFGGRGGRVHGWSDDDVDDESEHYANNGHRSVHGNHRQNFRFNSGGRGQRKVDNEGHHKYNTRRSIRPTSPFKHPSSVAWGQDEQNDGFDEGVRRSSRQFYSYSQEYQGHNYDSQRCGRGRSVETEIHTGQGNTIVPRCRRSLRLNVPFLRSLEEREPADIIMTLSHINTDFSGALEKSANNDQMIRLILSVLARAFTCDSMPEQLILVLTIIKKAKFLDYASSYFRNMTVQESPIKLKMYRKPIMDMITILSEMIQKNPTTVTDKQTLGIHTVLKKVIDCLKTNTSLIDKHVVDAFREFTEHKNILSKSNIRMKQIKLEKDEEEYIIEVAPPDDFREIEIFPQGADMKENRNQIYLRGNKVKGKYENLDHYLDVQFRLLREDFIGPLRDGVSEYIQAVTQKDNNLHNQDILIYERVQLVSPVCGDDGIHHQLQFDVNRLPKICWKSTKRLIYGSLVCLSPDNFETCYFATVIERKHERLESVMIIVHFEHSHQEINHMYGTNLLMAETTAYFEAYRHVLTGLKRFRQGDLPFEKYIISCASQVEAPAYIRRDRKPIYDLRPLIDEDSILKCDNKLNAARSTAIRHKQSIFTRQYVQSVDVDILDKESWPSAETLHLDESQYKAIRTALTKEFVITQGPPGTGKTFIGLKIVKTLLHNKQKWSVDPVTGLEDPRPMLIVCYTNHALDQFLEGIVKFYNDGVIRVGGRSRSEILRQYNLKNFRQKIRQMKKTPISVYKSRKAAMEEMDSRFSEITKICVTIQIATSNVLHEDFLQPFMGHHFQILKRQFRNREKTYRDISAFTNVPRSSLIVEWLGLANLISMEQPEVNLTAHDNYQNDRIEEMVDVEYDVQFIQKQRILDDDSEGFENNTHTRRQKKDVILSHATSNGSKAIAFDVEQIDKKSHGMNRIEWQTQRQQRKKIKRYVKSNLCNDKVMSEKEASHILDLVNMQMSDKWRLYRLWKNKYCDYYLALINREEGEYEAAAKRYREALLQEDKEILRCSTVIGMTTTGAARYQAILQEIQPKIIVVEEAAEVLEAHIITTLNKGCEHLILIGDHKQLKPSPTVYDLARRYNLDMSLFERMVNNEFRCDCLELQHRMRPEISQLMRHIYTRYIDHEDVKQYENIKGISTNLFFIDHCEPEASESDSKSHSNSFEAEYCVGLCRYILQQGYKPEQITVLTTYSGQLLRLEHLMPKVQFEGVKVTSVDSYQGEENDIILLSLVRSNRNGNIGFLKIENRVCVALSRARMGLYVIGNFGMLSKHGRSKLWRSLVADLRIKGFIGEGLLLNCQNHPNDSVMIAKKKLDFEKALGGFCTKRCNASLECGHTCTMYCHIDDKEHKEYRCMEICVRKICSKGHRCLQKCHQPCGDCHVYVEIVNPKCGHTQKVPCNKRKESFICGEKCLKMLSCGHRCKEPCGSAHTTECCFEVEKTWSCGHKANVLCFRKKDTICFAPCRKVFECGHICRGTCGKCFTGRLHIPCKHKCTRILVCGHQCSSYCNRCPPCTRKCENRCIHSLCSKTCGELCKPCMEPCTWKCEHYKCTKRCHEPCNRPRCDRPCKKKLDCGHQCIGLCGEPCPTDCRVCDAEKVTQLVFGHENEPNVRFVLLQDCTNKCIIESNAMDKYMDRSPNKEEEAVALKTCPLCRTAIRKSNRYGSIIKITLQAVESVKRQLLSSRRRIARHESEIEALLKEHFTKHITIKYEMIYRLRSMSEPIIELALVALKTQIEILRKIKKLEIDWGKLDDVAYYTKRREMLKFLKRFETWAKEEREVMTVQEIDDAECELLRSEHKLKVYLLERHLKKNGPKVEDRVCETIQTLKSIIDTTKPYKGKQRDTVTTYLRKVSSHTGLGIED